MRFNVQKCTVIHLGAKKGMQVAHYGENIWGKLGLKRDLVLVDQRFSDSIQGQAAASKQTIGMH